MSKIKLDLKDFKHVKSDKNTTTLQHKQGHMLTIAHAPLSPENQAQLKALADISKQDATPIQADESFHQQSKMAEGGEVNHDEPVLSPKDHYDEAVKHTAAMRDLHATYGEAAKSMHQYHYHTLMASHHARKAESVKPEHLAQGGNAGEQRKKIYGSQHAPSSPEMRTKHIEAIKQFAKQFLGIDMHPSGGKIDVKTGERRDKDAEVGVDKPDWRSGKLESQWNPDAMVHELAHLMLMPKGLPLKEGQTYMDKQYADVQKKYGYMKQKQSHGEIQPMALEQAIRRMIGLPSNKNSVPVPNNDPEMPLRAAVEDPTFEAGTRIQKPGGKWVDLIRQSRFLLPENKQRLSDIIEGRLKYHPEKGWHDNPHHMGHKVSEHKRRKAEDVQAQAQAPVSVLPQSPQNINAAQPEVGSAMGEDSIPKQNASGFAQGGEVNRVEDKTNYESQPDRGYGAILMRAEGGEVDPVTGQASQQMIKRNQEPKPHQAPKHETKYQDKDSARFGKIQHKAEGGHVHEGAAYCMHCGGRMMADGGDPGVPDYLAPNNPEPQAPASLLPNTNIPQMPNPSPEQAKLQGLQNTYDKILNEQGGYGPEYTFSGSGGKPKEILPGVAQLAEQMHQTAFDNDSRARAQEEEALQKKNELNAKFGVAPETQAPAMPSAIPSSGVPEQDDQTNAAPAKPLELGQQQGFDPSNPMGSMSQSLQSVMGANTAIGKAQQEQAQASLEAENQAVANKQNAMEEYQHSYNTLDQERQGFIHDIQNGYVDPAKYWDNHSKLMTGIGMILAGFNPTSAPNAAVNMLKFQMEQNLQSQMRNLGAKENLLSANMRQFGNLRDAQDMTRVMQNEYVQHQLNQAAAKAGTKIAVQNAIKANGMLALENAPLMMRLSTSMALQRMARNENVNPDAIGELIGQEMQWNPEMGKVHQAAYVPGVGISASLSPIPEQDKNRIQAYNNTLRLINEAIHFKDTHPGAEFSVQDRAQADTLMKNLGNQIRVAEDMGVFKPSEAQLMTSMLGTSPAGFFANARTIPKLKETMREKQNEYVQLLKAHNLPIKLQGQNLGQTQQASTEPQAPQGSFAPSRSKSGRPMVFRNGNWYYQK